MYSDDEDYSEIDSNVTHNVLKDLQKMETMITFDKGGMWERLSKPINDNTC